MRQLRLLLALTSGAGLGTVAPASAEITETDKWRKAWFGRPSPAGGVPED